MIIDCHTHIGKNDHINFSVDQLLHSMDYSKIDKSLVFAGELNDISNEFMLRAIEKHRDRLYGVACANPMKMKSMRDIQEEAKKIATWFMEGKIVACKFYTGYDHFYPYDKLIEDYLMDFEDVGCPVIFHSGDCLCSVRHAKLKYAHPLHIDDIAVDYPKLKIVIAHMGYPWHRDTAEILYKNKNVFADISGFVYGNFDWHNESHFREVVNEFLKIAGSDDQVLFGSDLPISNQDSYVTVAKKIFSDKIFAENPQKVFNVS